MDHGFDVDMNIDGITTWAKDFARDFKKNFSSLATPPEPVEPERPTSPVPPAPPAPPPTADASSGQPWTWSTTAGAPAAPTSAAAAEHSTEPLTHPEPSDAPVTPEPANTSDTAVTSQTMTAEDAEHLRVLEALERGDIDVDEALSRLDPGATRSS
jgi:hypothetical protein